jgi:hypothetical protein
MKREKVAGKNPTCLSPRNREACHSIGNALLQSIAKVRTQSTINKDQQKNVA